MVNCNVQQTKNKGTEIIVTINEKERTSCVNFVNSIGSYYSQYSQEIQKMINKRFINDKSNNTSVVMPAMLSCTNCQSVCLLVLELVPGHTIMEEVPELINRQSNGCYLT